MKEPLPSDHDPSTQARLPQLAKWQQELMDLVLRANGSQSSDSHHPCELTDILNSAPRGMLVQGILAVMRQVSFAPITETIGLESSQQFDFWSTLVRELYDLENTSGYFCADESLCRSQELASNIREFKTLLDAYVHHGQWKRASVLALKILEKDPNCSETRLILARSLRSSQDYQGSILQWNELLKRHPGESELYGELGNTFFSARNFQEAIASYRQVIQLNPEDISAHLSLFAAAREIKDRELMRQSFEHALSLSGVDSKDYESAVKAMLYQVEPEWTIRLIERWIEIFPENPVANHFLTSLQAEQQNETVGHEVNTAYIEAEFDGFADSFEHRLKLLGYRGPQALNDLLQDLFPNTSFARVLDAGCGTGWCGPVLRERAGQLDGVDLSEAMLQQASLKKAYDNLYQADLNDFLESNPLTYDLIVSLDTLIYVGELDPLFSRLEKALKPDGSAVFNLELLENEGGLSFQLQRNGRYAHSLKCIEKAVSASGLVPRVFERRVLRMEHGNPVYHVMIAVQNSPIYQDTVKKNGDTHQQQKSSPPTYRDKSTGDRIEIFQNVIRQQPGSGTAHFQLGNAFLSIGKLEEARQCFEEAQRLDNDEATLCNLGNAYAQMGNLPAAFRSFEMALELNPDFVPALNNAGRASFELGEKDRAVEYLNHAVNLQPDNPKSHVFLGNIFLANGATDKAIASYQKAVQCDANQPDVHMLLGNALLEENQLSAAAASYVKAQQLNPQNPFIYDALGNINHLRGQITEASFCFLRALQLYRGEPLLHSHMIFNMAYDFTVSLADLVAETQTWANALRQSSGFEALKKKPHLSLEPDRKLSIGFVHPHASIDPARQLLKQFHGHLEKEKYQLRVYTGPEAKPEHEKNPEAEGMTLRYMEFNQPETLSRQIENDRIDILVDLSGHRLGNCLALHLLKPAPLHLIWPIECEPPGLKEFDCLIADSEVLSKEGIKSYVEHPVLTEGPFRLYTPPQLIPDLRASTDTGNPPRFASLARMPCLSAEVLSCWGQILIETPKSSLLIANENLGDPAIQRRILEVFDKMGVSANRLRLQSVESEHEKLMLWRDVDIGLDPFPFNCPDDAFQALLMGCPVISLAGSGIQQRTTKSLLANASLGELVAESKTDYINNAVELAGNESKRGDYLSTLRSVILNSTNCDAAGFVLNFEQLLRKQWKDYCRQNEPA